MSSTMGEHVEHLSEALDVLKTANLQAKRNKC